MTAAPLGGIANFLPNEYYPTEEPISTPSPKSCRKEYQAIVQAGILFFRRGGLR